MIVRDITLMIMGVCIFSNFQGLFHDFIGEEASRKIYENSPWVSSWITVPLHVVCILICIYWYIKIKGLN